MLKVKEVILWNRPFIMALKEDKLAFFGTPQLANACFKKDFPIDEIVASTEGFNPFESQIKDYVEGKRSTFDLPLYLTGTPFQRSVYEVLCTIPFGTTVSYTELAVKVGDVKKVRAVANAVGKNRHLIIMPCHRVLAKDGSLGGFSAGLDLKRVLLKHEERGERI